MEKGKALAKGKAKAKAKEISSSSSSEAELMPLGSPLPKPKPNPKPKPKPMEISSSSSSEEAELMPLGSPLPKPKPKPKPKPMEISSSSSSEEGDVRGPPHFHYCLVSGETSWHVLKWFIVERPSSKIVVLFLNQHSVRLYCSLLEAAGIEALAVHSGVRSQVKRGRYRRFRESDACILLCTDLRKVKQTLSGAADWFLQFDPPVGGQDFFQNAQMTGAYNALLFLRDEERGFVNPSMPNLKSYEIPDAVMASKGLPVLVKQSSEREEAAKKACAAFLSAYRRNKESEIFKYADLDLQGVVDSFGIPSFAKEIGEV